MERSLRAHILDFLHPKALYGISVRRQLLIVGLLTALTALWMMIEWRTSGTTFGYPPSPSIIVMPLIEEFFFRGILLRVLIYRYNNKIAIMISSILFGLWHAKNWPFLSPDFLAYQMLYTGLIIGPLFGWITIRTRSIWPAIILHYIHNLLSAGSIILMRYIG